VAGAQFKQPNKFFSIVRALHEMAARIKMVKNRLIFVEKLANSQLLAAFSA
jgi:hypothetical protein